MSERIELAHPQAVLMQEIADERMKRADVALTYAMAMVSSDPVEWPTVNRAIMDRWSMAGLKWIKTRAWKLVREKQEVSS